MFGDRERRDFGREQALVPARVLREFVVRD